MRKPVPIACTLSPDAMPDRLAAWAALRGRALLDATEIDGGVRLRFAADGGDEARALVAAEKECCAFLTITEHGDRHNYVVDVVAPAGAEAVPRLLAGWD